MSSFTTSSNETQMRTQRRLRFDGFNVPDTGNSSQERQSAIMLTSTPDRKSHEKENERLDVIQSIESQSSETCLLQLQNARQLLHSMSRANIPSGNEPAITDDQQPRSEIFTEGNPELAYYKSSLESERNRRKQLETLIDVQQQRLTEAESELIQLRAQDHKKTLCMKQLEQMIPNVVDEWKLKEAEYKTKLNNLTQQVKQMEQTNKDKVANERQQFDTQINEKNLLTERLIKENENLKQDYESLQSKTKQNDQRMQQMTKDAEQVKQRTSTIESDLRLEIKNGETRFNDLQTQLDKKQEQMEQLLRDQSKSTTDYQAKIRQLENDLDEQHRENNVLKMELELREAKYRAQTESLKIQLIRDAETKLSQRLEEQHAKHMQIEEELNELHRSKLLDLQEKHEQILCRERYEHETHMQALFNKIEQMKSEIETIQSIANAERQDLAKKLQDVFESALLKGSSKPSLSQSETVPSVKGKNNEFISMPPLPSGDHPTNISTIRSLSSRLDSLVDQTNRVATGFDFSSHLPLPNPQENAPQWFENNQNNFLSSQPHSTLPSPYFRSTPIDSLQEWHPQTITQSSHQSNTNQMTYRSQSADPSSSGLFSIYPSNDGEQQKQSSNSFSLDSNLNIHHLYQPTVTSYRSNSSVTPNVIDHQQEVQVTISKDSIENHHSDHVSATNESLTRYVKMLLDRSPNQDNNASNKHPLIKTNRSLHDIQMSIEQLNLVERDHKVIVDDLILSNESHSSHIITPRQRKSSITTHGGGAKKRLDYELHSNINVNTNNNANCQKQSNTDELFERLSQPKVRVKKDKPKQQPAQSSSAGHGAWK